MTFLVYDNREFIRDDIKETLETAFPGVPVVVLDDLSQLTTDGAPTWEGATAILSLKNADDLGVLAECPAVAGLKGIILIGEAAALCGFLAEAKMVTFLTIPFSSHSLLGKIRSVSFDQQ